MNIARFAVAHFKALIFFTLALCVAGIVMAASFPVSILPDVTFPRLVAIAEGGDRPARAMEIAVTRPIEEAVAAVPGIKKVRSTTQRGATETSIDFEDGTDMVQAQNLVNAKINEIRANLPPECDVSVERMNPTVFPVLGLSLESSNLSQTQLWDLANYQLRPRLTRVPGVARVVVQGGRTPEIAVEADPQRMAALHLDLDDLSKALSGANVVRATGRFDQQFQQWQALVSGDVQTVDSLKKLVVTQRGGFPILLSQVASVSSSVEDRSTIVTANGRESVLLNIVRQPSANSVAVVSGVKQQVATLKSTLPPGVHLTSFYDQSILINDAISSVRDAVLIGAVLAVFVLMLFLGDWRATAVTAAIIPSTVLITLLCMRLVGMTLNLMTLGALAVGIGLVIDDAIVVVENVFRHLGSGQSRSDAVLGAAREIAAPMISSTLTTVVVFLPLTLLVGVAGAFFGALAITLSIALLVSLVLALLLSPSLCAAFLRVREGHDESEGGPLFRRLVVWYEKVLAGALQRRWLFPVAAVCILAVTYGLGSRLPTGFMPEMDEGSFVLDYQTPPGTSLVESNRILTNIENILAKTPEVASYSRRTGTELGFAITEPNRGDFAVMLKENRKRRIEDVMDDVRGQVEATAPGADTEFIQVLQDLIGDLSGAPSPIEIKLFGNDQDQLAGAAAQVAAKLGGIKGAADIQSGVVESGPEWVLHVDALRAGRAGLTADDIATQMSNALFGTVATQIVEGDHQIPVRVRLPAAFRGDPQRLKALPITSPQGYRLPLSALGTLENVAGSTEMNREDQRRLIAVTSQIDGRDLGGTVADIQKMMGALKLPAGVTYELGGQYQSQQSSFANLAAVLALAIVLVFGVMLFQFGSFTAPITILLVMPLAMFGVVLGLWCTETPLNVSSFMGAIMLVGIVVKNGILLFDQAQAVEKTGVDVETAVREAAKHRLRPILMTTLTAILGLAPLAMGWGAGAEMQKPLAVAVIGGLSFSTLFTLVLGPLLYVQLKRLQMPIRVPKQKLELP